MLCLMWRTKKARSVKQEISWSIYLLTIGNQTALHKAALHGHLLVVRYLLPDKADVHACDADGWTALHNACSKVPCIPRTVLISPYSSYICHRVTLISCGGFVKVEVQHPN